MTVTAFSTAAGIPVRRRSAVRCAGVAPRAPAGRALRGRAERACTRGV